MSCRQVQCVLDQTLQPPNHLSHLQDVYSHVGQVQQQYIHLTTVNITYTYS